MKTRLYCKSSFIQLLLQYFSLLNCHVVLRCVKDFFVLGLFLRSDFFCNLFSGYPDCFTPFCLLAGIPPETDWNLDPNASYVYYCANETVHGMFS